MVFENMRKELSELVGLVRQSERYCTSIADRPELASDSSHAVEVQREQRIAGLSAKYGITS